MTPERKHQLNKLLAEVAGKTVRENYEEVIGVNGPELALVLVDERQFIWDPVDDANDAEEAVRSQVRIMQYAAIYEIVSAWYAKIGKNFDSVFVGFHRIRRIAFALAVEQWWEAKKASA